MKVLKENILPEQAELQRTVNKTDHMLQIMQDVIGNDFALDKEQKNLLEQLLIFAWNGGRMEALSNTWDELRETSKKLAFSAINAGLGKSQSIWNPKNINLADLASNPIIN